MSFRLNQLLFCQHLKLSVYQRRVISEISLSRKYDPLATESKWQRIWNEERTRKSKPPKLSNTREKYYALAMFPYPSGRLHMGHVRVYTISDCMAQFARMTGKQVIHPMGWDAFGLPAENAAIERSIPPDKWTQDNIHHMKSQLASLGFNFDWPREIATCSPDYYKWTQWLFLQLFKAGLAYQKESVVNWDPVDQTVLANEQVDALGKSWRSGAVVERRYLKQWFLRITDYAKDLHEGLQAVDWPETVVHTQRNWIGESHGIFFEFPICDSAENDSLRKNVSVFTTRPETVFGVTFLALSYDHPLLKEANVPVPQAEKNHEGKAGVFSGLYAIHPFTKAKLPIYAASYVKSGYAMGAVMGVPRGDSRDLQFAQHHNLPVIEILDETKKMLKNAGKYTGMTAPEAAESISEAAESQGFGSAPSICYRLSDWLISRQRYWGAPIPIIHCPKCGPLPVPDQDLPVTLPEGISLVEKGRSVLEEEKDWVNCLCPCSEKRPSRRETDTMDTFMDSSWYFLRYLDPHNSDKAFDTQQARLGMPVDLYVGGKEHANLHLLYARFITHFLHDQGLVDCKEPFKRLLSQGIVRGKTLRSSETGEMLTSDEVFEKDSEVFRKDTESPVVISWEKMSKRKRNGVDPQEITQTDGADAIRLFILHKAPPELDVKFDVRAISGMIRWMKRLWFLTWNYVGQHQNHTSESSNGHSERLEEVTEKTVKMVTECLSKGRSFNVAIANLMTLSNALKAELPVTGPSPQFRASFITLCKMLSPFAPHIAEEIWEALGTIHSEIRDTRVLDQPWPTLDLKEETDQPMPTSD
eukprot:m.4747 g.4747  ORF g.4747 m.4747 type:complete len:812 (+) comp11215_c0_seq2:181-2616(+)